MTRRRVAAGLFVAAVALTGFVARWSTTHRAQLALKQAAAAQAHELRVQVVIPKPTSKSRELVLPGSAQPLEETTVYPRASGYVTKWYHDIGDRVRTGELLAVIDTPELDQQLLQAQAQLAQTKAQVVQAQANSEFSRQDLKRYEVLTPSGLASQQELEKSKALAEVNAASIGVSKANENAQLAEIARLQRLKSFARVLAPFDGIVTLRSVETGSLVTAGNGSPLFRITAIDPVRVFVQIPQPLASAVGEGISATIRVREDPRRVFEGKVTRTTRALDPTTRTMTTEIRVPNPRGELLTGMYVEVNLNLLVDRQTWEIPSTALLNDSAGVRVAVVRDDATVHFVPVTIARDHGATIELADGVDGSVRIVRLTNAELTEGRRVTIAP